MSVPPEPRPLTPAEERMWRTLIRLMIRMPRAVDEDLIRRSGMSLTRYVVLMRLSEAPERAMRLSDLADAASISPSRLTRVVQALVTDGLVTRTVVPGDGRAGLATLTGSGLQRLEQAWPAHLAGVRALVLDHLDGDDLRELHRLAERLLQATVTATDPGADGSPPDEDDPAPGAA